MAARGQTWIEQNAAWRSQQAREAQSDREAADRQSPADGGHARARDQVQPEIADAADGVEADSETAARDFGFEAG